MISRQDEGRRSTIHGAVRTALLGMLTLCWFVSAGPARAHKLVILTVGGHDPVTGEPTSRRVPLVQADRHTTATPTELGFGAVEVGSSRVLELAVLNIDPDGDTLSVTVTPSGSAPPFLAAARASGGPASFDLGPGLAETIRVTYAPDALGDDLDDSVLVTSSEVGFQLSETVEVAVTGTTFAEPRLRLLTPGSSTPLTALSLDFGMVPASGSQYSRSFRLKNVGSGSTGLEAIEGLSFWPSLVGWACVTVNDDEKCFWNEATAAALRSYDLAPGEEIPIRLTWTPAEAESFTFQVAFPGGADATPALAVRGTSYVNSPDPPPSAPPGSHLRILSTMGTTITSLSLPQSPTDVHRTVETSFLLHNSGTAAITDGRLSGVGPGGCIEIHDTDKCFHDADYAPFTHFTLAPGEQKLVRLVWAPLDGEPRFHFDVAFLGAANQPVVLSVDHQSVAFEPKVGNPGGGSDGEVRAYPDEFGGIRGLFNDNAFFSATDFDHVNLSSGNLVVTLPIGQRFQIGPSFDYGLTLVHNSNLWHVRDLGDLGVDEPLFVGEQFTVPIETNAGLGWWLSLGGELYIDPAFFGGGVLNWPNRQGHRWLYVDATGGSHPIDLRAGGEADTAYAQDDSFLRLRETPTTLSRVWVDLPDGLVQTFERTAEHCFKDSGTIHNYCFRLTRIEDPFGNFVGFTYSYGAAGLTVAILDSLGRQTVVEYSKMSVEYVPGTSRELYSAERVLLPAFGGATAVWDLVYEAQAPSISRQCEVDSNLLLNASDAFRHVTVPVLKELALPEPGAGRYVFTTDTSHFDHNCHRDAGALLDIETPSHGHVSYDYRTLRMPVGCPRSAGSLSSYPDVTEVRGIAQRTVRDHEGSPVSRQSFHIQLLDRPTSVIEAGPGCNRGRTLKATVAHWPPIPGSQLYRVENHYHTAIETESGLPDDPLDPEYGDWKLRDAGLPVWKKLSPSKLGTHGERLYLSTEVAECPDADPGVADLAANCTLRERTFKSFAYESAPNCNELFKELTCPIFEQILRGERREWIDDADDGSPIRVESYVETLHSGYDGFGHFRRSDTESGVISGSGTVQNRRSSYSVTHYNPAQSEVPLDPLTFELGTLPLTHAGGWNLGLFSFQEENSDGLARRTDFDFDATGFLRCRRTRVDATGLGDRDLAVSFLDENGDGFPEWEEHSGGDDHSAGTAAGCPSSKEYRIKNTHQYGRVATRRFHRFDGTAIGPLLADDTVDPTGLVKVSCDHGVSPPLCMTHSHDKVGRLTATAPVTSGLRPTTTLTYTLLPNGGRIEVEQKNGATGPLLAHQKHVFDALGREIRVEKKVSGQRAPSGWIAQEKDHWGQGSLLAATAILDRATLDALTPEQKDPWRYRFDAYDYVGRPLLFRNPAGEQTRWSYGGFHRRQTQTATTSIDRRIDHLERPRTVYEGSPGQPPYRTTQTTYSHGTETASRSDSDLGVTQSRSRTVDARGFLVEERLPEKSAPVIFQYDSLGNPIERSDNGNVLAFLYDDAGRLIRVRETLAGNRLLEKRTYAPGTGRLQSATRYNYLTPADTEGYVAFLLTDPANTQVFAVTDTLAYDDKGNVSSKTTAIDEYELTPAGAQVDSLLRAQFEQSWTWDLLGRVRTASYPRCTGGVTCSSFAATDLKVRYSYALGELTAIDTTQDLLAADPPYLPLLRFRYHPGGLVERLDRYSESGTWIGHDSLVEQSLASGATMPRIGSLTVVSSTGQTIWQSGGYRYDGAGRIQSIGATSYRYDGVGRLTQAGGLSYAYDRFDNLRTPVDPGITALTIDALTNRISGLARSGALQGVAYDPRGNFLSADGWRAHYDVFDKLIAWACMEPGQTPDHAYQSFSVYTADGARILTVDRVRRAEMPDGEFSTALYTVPGLSTETVREFRHGDDSVAPGNFVFGVKSFVGPHAIFRQGSDGQTTTGWEVRHLSRDHLGSVVAAWNGSSWNVDSYSPWGRRNDSPAFLIPEAPAFAGHVSDRNGANLELPRDGNGMTTFMGARTYAQAFGRFLQVDPARNGWNAYAYAGNDPINNVDPDGKAEQAAGNARIYPMTLQEFISEKRSQGLQRARDQLITHTPVLVAGLFEFLTGVPLDEGMFPASQAQRHAQVLVAYVTTASNLSMFANPGLGFALRSSGRATAAKILLGFTDDVTKVEVSMGSAGRFGSRFLVSGNCPGPCGGFITRGNAVFLNSMDNSRILTLANQRVGLGNIGSTALSITLDSVLPDEEKQNLDEVP